MSDAPLKRDGGGEGGVRKPLGTQINAGIHEEPLGEAGHTSRKIAPGTYWKIIRQGELRRKKPAENARVIPEIYYRPERRGSVAGISRFEVERRRFSLASARQVRRGREQGAEGEEGGGGNGSSNYQRA